MLIGDKYKDLFSKLNDVIVKTVI